MPVATDRDLYERGIATLVASWDAIAGGTPGAAVLRLSGATAAVVPTGPERDVYNNAVLDRGLSPADAARAIAATEDAYRAAAVERYAVWVHECDGPLRVALGRRGYAITETTRAMALALDRPRTLPTAAVELVPGRLEQHRAHLEAFGLPRSLLRGVDDAAFHVVMGRLEGVDVATGLTHDHDGDCGVFNVSTVEAVRRRGIGTALTLRLLDDATARGCTTASLQSTPIAERVYAGAGFRDLGKILEYAA